MDFFYDSQIRRYLTLLARIFADIKVESEPDDNGIKTETVVPIRYGDMSRQVAQILQQNSENTSLPSPMFSYYITGLRMDPNRRADPQWVSKRQVTERKYIEGSGYTNEVGNKYSLERHMPVPYILTIKLDCLTNSTTTKLMIMEQLAVLFNPSMQLQQNMNTLDWTSLFEVTLTEINWSNRSIPVGGENGVEMDIFSMTFDVPIWLNPPAKLSTQKIIKKIITDVHSVANISSVNADERLFEPFSSLSASPTRIIVTPNNYKVKIGVDGLANNKVQLLDSYGNVGPTWNEFFEVYNTNLNTNSAIKLKTNTDFSETDGEIYGVVSISDDPTILNFDVDVSTLPNMTIAPINKIIDPTKHYPGYKLDVATAGQRYLLLDNIPLNTGTSPWGSIEAYTNQIIEYNGSEWFVSFSGSNNEQYVKNLTTGDHFKYNGEDWIYTFYGEYTPGFWELYF